MTPAQFECSKASEEEILPALLREEIALGGKGLVARLAFKGRGAGAAHRCEGSIPSPTRKSARQDRSTSA